MLNGYTDRDIELSEKIVTRKLTVNSGDFHILNDNFLDLKLMCDFYKNKTHKLRQTQLFYFQHDGIYLHPV